MDHLSTHSTYAPIYVACGKLTRASIVGAAPPLPGSSYFQGFQCGVPANVCELVVDTRGTLVLGVGVDGAMLPGEEVVAVGRAL
jgi:hypothetical protein